MSKPIDVDTKRCRFGTMSDEAANVIMQAEAWFNSRKDHLTEVIGHAKKPDTKLQVGDQTIDDDRVRLGLAIGLEIALQVFGEWPISIVQNETDEDE